MSKIILVGTDLNNGTFSMAAYEDLSSITDSLPFPTAINEHRWYLVPGNPSIIPTLQACTDSFALLPFETLERGKIKESVAGISLLQADDDITVFGAYKKRIELALMTKRNTPLSKVEGVLGHREAIAACTETLAKLGITNVIPVDNNATAQRLVCNAAEYAQFAALGPNNQSAELTVKQTNCEDRPAYTTFLLLHNHGGLEQRLTFSRPTTSCRALVLFDLIDMPGTLVTFLSLFSEWNLRHIEPIYRRGQGYRFVMELSCSRDEQHKLSVLLHNLAEIAPQHGAQNVACFGPYPVLEDDA